jgi:small neutral amino acid transporter SnatA (MarC family)
VSEESSCSMFIQISHSYKFDDKITLFVTDIIFNFLKVLEFLLFTNAICNFVLFSIQVLNQGFRSVY